MVWYQPANMLLVSSADRRAHARRAPERPAAILGYPLDAASPALLHLSDGLGLDLHPLGLSLFVDDTGRASLFVVNHGAAGASVEIFDLASRTLSHRASIRGELMTSPNDLAAVGPRSFYVTNDHGHTSGLLRSVEEYGQRPWSYLLYYDGERFQRAAEGFKYANGVAVSADGATLYVAATVGRSLHVFDRDRESGALSPRHVHRLDTGVDNLSLDADGALWIAAHPKLLTWVSYAKDAGRRSPSQVLKVTDPGAAAPQVEEVYLELGAQLSGSSVAFPAGELLLIGSVLDPRFLLCRPSR
jgi:arylesterase/paraoxonase